MGDEEPQCKVEYLDTADGAPEEANWIKRAGKAKVTYVNSSTFEGTYDAEKLKQGEGTYVWMAPNPEDEEAMVEKARYTGNYKDGKRNGYGKMVYPNGDIYEGEWVDGKMSGEGSYTYKGTGDIYSGSWWDNKKHGTGRYEFAADKSMLFGSWSAGELISGNWELKGYALYEGQFQQGRPVGDGRFIFNNGYTQNGTFQITKAEEEGEEGAPINVAWKGNSIVSF